VIWNEFPFCRNCIAEGLCVRIPFTGRERAMQTISLGASVSSPQVAAATEANIIVPNRVPEMAL
jgi:hypothetical protein